MLKVSIHKKAKTANGFKRNWPLPKVEAGSFFKNKSVTRQDAECRAPHGWACSDFYF
jgi:hypothetical protein